MKATEAEIYRYRYEKALFELELKLGIQYNNQNQIAQWNSYDTLTKKKIVMQSIKNKKSMPRQKLTFKAQDHGITFEKAKKVFVTDKL